jgi:hypothetical protein
MRFNNLDANLPGQTYQFDLGEGARLQQRSLPTDASTT